MTTIANMTDAAIADQAAKAAKGAESSGMKAILLAAILFRVRGASKATEGTLYTAMDVAGIKESSATNYVSKARAAAQDKFFPWTIDVNKPLDDVRQAIQPEFTAFWGGINAIKKNGPDAKGEGRKGKDKDKPDEAKTVETVPATPVELATAVTSSLADIPMDMLLAMRAAIDAEIARRSEMEKVAA
jgi:hypothetical protein